MPNRKTVAIIWISLCVYSWGCRGKDTLFSEVSTAHSSIQFANILPDRPQLNILYHLNYYNGGGVATGDINNDGLTDIYFTANQKGQNKLYLNKGNLVFEDITDQAGVAGSADWYNGVTMADVNGDGLLDIYVCALTGKLGLKGHNELFINNGNNQFTESAARYGLDLASFAQQAAFFDYDHDGDLDCIIVNQSEHPFSNIVDTSNRRRYDSLAGDRLYRNDIATTGKFTDVSKEAGIWQSKLGFGLGLAVSDVNNDGWDDIYVGNDFHENDYYYINQGNGTFKDEGNEHFGHYSRFSMGNDIADYNNDGQLDILTVDMLPPDEPTLKTYGSDDQMDIYRQKIESNGFQPQYSRNCLQRNNGNGSSFSEVGLMAGISATDWSWSPLFSDFDNDGMKDILITNGIPKRPVDLDYVRYISDVAVQKKMNASTTLDKSVIERIPDGAAHAYLFKGSSTGSFSDVSRDWGLEGRKGYFNGAAFADLDNDGDLEIVINCIGEKALVYQNNTAGKHYLSLQFDGSPGNSFGIGAKAYLYAGGHMQYQELMLTRGFQSSSEPRLHFGLDSINKIDSLLIVWPNQQFQVLRGLSSDTLLRVSQSQAGGQFEFERFFPPAPALFEDVTAKTGVTWRHHENDFRDFNIQYLIPHMESTRGPKIAVADVNGDGLDDFYACGAKGYSGTLMIQTATGRFLQAEAAVFEESAAGEDVDAVFFDADQNGTPDLYVVSGGNEYPNDDSSLSDRLYLNDGHGHFSRAWHALPGILTNKSTVSVADVDQDGDNDLFVGTLADSRKYGIPQTSYLLINDGQGHYKMADSSVIDLRDIGMVTSSSFADMNKDGWPDLVVTGEWMGVKLFMNKAGHFAGAEIPLSTGIWQSLRVQDVNGDGLPDILAGNWGHNTKLWAGKNGPCKLFVNDFDKNGSVDQILCYMIDGKDYTFLAKDELERAIPVLKKAYLTYSEVAGKDVQYMFYDLFRDYLELRAETLSSSCFVNDGNGSYHQVELPGELQLAPVFAFQSLGGGQVLGAGNFYGAIPYEGRYDALRPTVFSMAGGNQRPYVLSGISLAPGEVRDMKWLRVAGGNRLLLVARNNEPLIFLKPLTENEEP